MKQKDWLTDEQVEAEIARLTADPDVRLARAEVREKYKRRQQLYGLRNLKSVRILRSGILQNTANSMSGKY